jgi:hypothetical protein
MHELGGRLAWSDFVETHVFNSNKVTALYHPVLAANPAARARDGEPAITR